MDLAHLVCALIAMLIAIVLAIIPIRALSFGSIKPFRMNRWSEPDPVNREESPVQFWQWTIAYFAFSIGAFTISILTALGKIKIR